MSWAAGSRGELGAGVHVPVRDGHQAQLLRREPQGERAGEVLDEHAAEPLERAEDRAVDHHRAMSKVVLPGVLHVEALRESEIALHGRELPEAADRIAEVKVDLRPVESALARIDRRRHDVAVARLDLLEHAAHHGFRVIP
jgi:hypothetical protein